MTAATISWPKPNLLSNGDFEDVAASDFTDWTESGTVATISGVNANGGVGSSLGMAEDAYAYQDNAFVTSNERALDQLKPYHLEFYAKAGSGDVDGFKVQVFLLESTTLRYSWDFDGGRWVASTTQDMDDGEAYGMDIGTNTTWTRYILPKIYPPAESGGSLSDSWIVRVRVWNNSSGSCQVGVDDVILSEYRGSNSVRRVGRYTVAHNGVDYPVKYDHRTGSASELSLHYPYQHDNSALPTVTAKTSGGSITDAYWIGYAYTFLNADIGEESALPLGVEISSAYFVQQAGSSSNANSNDLDFSAIELPNQENAKTTDFTDGDTIVVYRTREFATEDEATTAVENDELWFEGTVAAGGTFASTKDNDTLVEEGLRSGFIANPVKMPMPFMDVSAVYRSRLFFAGSKHHRLGSVSVTNDDEKVTGITPALSTTATHWGRWADWMVFNRDGDSRSYDVERYVYTNDDGSPAAETLRLSEVYSGVTGSTAGYTLRPRSGRVYFSEEGKPYDFAGTNYFTLDGDEGGSVVSLGTVGRALLAMTRDTTYAFDYQEFPGDLGDIATPISRDIGCIAPKSFVEVRGVGYWLSDHGIVRSSGGSVEVIGNSLQDIFTDPDDPDYVERSRGDQLAEAYGGHYPDEQQILMAVRSVNATQGCDLVLVYNYFYDTWDMFRVRAGVTGFHESVADDGQHVLLFTDGFGQVHRWGEGTTDGAGEVNNRGQLRGKVVSATALGAVLSSADALYDAASSATYTSASLGLDGAFIKVTSATDGSVQWRRIFDNDRTSIRITKAWATTPSADDTWEIGGIDHRWKLKNSTISLPGRIKNLKAVNIYHKDEAEGGTVKVEYYPDFATTDALTAAGKPVDQFGTGGSTRSQVRCHDTTGYVHRIEFDASGPENPFETRFLEAVFEAREKDK